MWPESLVTIFRYGFSVRVVAYTGDDDLESREAWNTAKHDEGVSGVSAGISTFRWSSLRQKLTVVMTLYKRLWDWQKVKASLVELYVPGEQAQKAAFVEILSYILFRGPRYLRHHANHWDAFGFEVVLGEAESAVGFRGLRSRLGPRPRGHWSPLAAPFPP